MHRRRRRSPLLPSIACAVGAACAGVCSPGTARAGVAATTGLVAHDFQLGEQDFPAGTTPVYDWRIKQAGLGEQAPFNGQMFGDDRTRSLGAFQFTHTFDLSGLTVRAAELTIGLVDIDSPIGSTKPTIRVSFNGVVQPSAPFTGISSAFAQSSVDVVTVPVSLDLLKSGALTVTVQAIRHAPNFLGNAIGADFSRLTIFADPQSSPSGPGVPDGPSGPSGPGSNDGGGGGGSNGGGGGGDGPPNLVPLPSGGPVIAAALLALAGQRLFKRRAARIAG